jgi:hypothetical protein
MKSQLNALNLILLTTLISLPFFMSCDESIQSIDHPTLPRHSLHVDGDIQLQAEIQWVDSNKSLKTHIRAINATNDTTTIEAGSCAFQILAYNSTDSGKELIWHSQMPEHFVCLDELFIYQIPPDESLVFDRQQYISGNRWKRPIPKGEWEFEVRAKSENDQVIRIPANRVSIK